MTELELLHEKQDGKCYICRTQTSLANGTIDHIIPKNASELYGTDPELINQIENKAFCCSSCNSSKSDQTYAISVYQTFDVSPDFLKSVFPKTKIPKEAKKKACDLPVPKEIVQAVKEARQAKALKVKQKATKFPERRKLQKAQDGKCACCGEKIQSVAKARIQSQDDKKILVCLKCKKTK